MVGSKAVSAGTDGTLRVWDLMSGACLQTLGRKMGQTWAIRALHDGRRVVTGSMDKVGRSHLVQCDHLCVPSRVFKSRPLGKGCPTLSHGMHYSGQLTIEHDYHWHYPKA